MDIDFNAVGDLEVLSDVVVGINHQAVSTTSTAKNSMRRSRGRPPKYPAPQEQQLVIYRRLVLLREWY